MEELIKALLVLKENKIQISLLQFLGDKLIIQCEGNIQDGNNHMGRTETVISEKLLNDEKALREFINSNADLLVKTLKPRPVSEEIPPCSF